MGIVTVCLVVFLSACSVEAKPPTGPDASIEDPALFGQTCNTHYCNGAESEHRGEDWTYSCYWPCTAYQGREAVSVSLRWYLDERGCYTPIVFVGDGVCP